MAELAVNNGNDLIHTGKNGEETKAWWVYTPSTQEMADLWKKVHGDPAKLAEVASRSPTHTIHLEADGTYKGFNYIKRDAPINHGVEFSLGEKFITVVDDKNDPDLEQAYTEFTQSIARFNGQHTQEQFLKEVNDFVVKIMPYDTNRAKMTALYSSMGLQPGAMVKLGLHIKNHFGVCRHQGLLSAYIIERGIKEGLLSGKVSADRNVVRDVNGEQGGHLWTRFTDTEGAIWIVDPANKETKRLVDTDPSHDWLYWRPSDYELFEKNELEKERVKQLQRLGFTSGDAIKVRVGQGKYNTWYIAGDPNTKAQFIPIKGDVKGQEETRKTTIFEIYSDNPHYLIQHIQGTQNFDELRWVLDRTMSLKYGEPLVIYNIQDLKQLISDIKSDKKTINELEKKFPINELIETVKRLKGFGTKTPLEQVQSRLATLAIAA